MRQLCGTCVELSAVFQRTNSILRVLPLPFTASPSCTLSILLSLDTSAWPSIGCLLPHAALRSLLMSLGALPSCAPSSSWRGTGLQPFSPTFCNTHHGFISLVTSAILRHTFHISSFPIVPRDDSTPLNSAISLAPQSCREVF